MPIVDISVASGMLGDRTKKRGGVKHRSGGLGCTRLLDHSADGLLKSAKSQRSGTPLVANGTTKTAHPMPMQKEENGWTSAVPT